MYSSLVVRLEECKTERNDSLPCHWSHGETEDVPKERKRSRTVRYDVVGCVAKTRKIYLQGVR